MPPLLPVSLDCETARIAESLQAPPLACVAIGADGIEGLLHHTAWQDEVYQLLTDPEILIVGANIAFDFADLASEAPWLFPVIFDTYEANRITDIAIRQKLADIARGIYRTRGGYNLEDLSNRHLGRQLDKDTWRLRYGELRALPLEAWPDGAKLYPREDVRSTIDIYHVQEKKYGEWLADQYRQTRAAFWLQLMKSWGLRTDEIGIRELAKRTKKDFDEVSKILTREGLLWGTNQPKGGPKGKPGSRNTKATKARIVKAYTDLGKPVPTTDKGQASTDKVACEESGDPILIKYSELSSLQTVLSKDIPLLGTGIDHPIHAYFEILLETGRTSSSPNVQNPKKHGGIRECFVPRCLRCSHVSVADRVVCSRCGGPASCFWSCDYGGLELCTLAQVCLTGLGRSRLAEVLNQGLDPHLMMASAILGGRDYDELVAIKKAGPGPECQSRFSGHCACRYCEVTNARQVAKVCNFGFPGGLGAASLVFFALNNYGVHLTTLQAKALKRLWLQTWPEMRGYFAHIARIAERPLPQIEQLFSGRFRVGSYTELCNTLFQGLGADIAKGAGWQIAREMYDFTLDSPLYGSRLDNFIHDEFVGESPLTIAHECANRVAEIMITEAKPWLPDVRIDVEPALMFRYSKDAKTKKVNGRLVPWDT